MNLDEITGLDYTIEVDEDERASIRFFDPETSVELGSIRIAKKRSRALMAALTEIFRELHGEFEPHDDARTILDNKHSGTIRFIE